MNKPPSAILIIQDCEPDDYLSMMMLNKYVDANVPFRVIVVSPDPDKHYKDTIDLFETMNTGRRVSTWKGASYSREKGFVEPEDQTYLEDLDKFFKWHKEESIDVMLLTTCYGLMHQGTKLSDGWGSKVRTIWHMGGEGVPRTVTKENETKIQRGYGFNWRVGTKYAKEFMDTVPTHQRIFLEPAFYNPDFQKKFNGVVSICPKTFPKFIEALRNSKKETAKKFITHNANWVYNMLSNNKECRKFYEEGKENEYIGPADILLTFCYLTHSCGVNKCKLIKRTFTCEGKEKVFNNDTYSMLSISEIDYAYMEEFLIGVIE